MARAALLRRLIWQTATIAEIRAESETASTLVLDVPEWPGHLGGQHVDVRLTAEDGYSTQRSYSIASAGMPVQGKLEITVQRVEGGEVSPYFIDVAHTGDQFEVRGPIGGYFTWEPGDGRPVLAIAGGSGVVPLMSMARAHSASMATEKFRLVYSTRGPDETLYAAELAEMPDIELSYAYTRAVPIGWLLPPARLDAMRLAQFAFPPADNPSIFVCGPTGFVETIANLLVAAGHDAKSIKTERFGPTGGER